MSLNLVAMTPNLRKKSCLKRRVNHKEVTRWFFFNSRTLIGVHNWLYSRRGHDFGTGKQKECLMKIYLYSHQWRNPWDRTCQIVCEISPAICCFSIHHWLMHSFVENPSVKFHFCQSSSPGDRKKDEIEYCIICFV